MQFTPKTEALIFDLDGTLWDASESTALASQKVCQDLGFSNKVTADDVRSVSGLPFEECVKKLFGKTGKAHASLKENLNIAEKWQIAKEGGVIYPGVVKGIQELANRYPLFIVSNCQDWYLNAFLEKSGLARFFRDSICFGQNGLSKKDNLKKIARNHALKNPLYIGDTAWDQHSAFYAGIKFLYAEYGFGNLNVNRTPYVKDFAQFTELMLRGKKEAPQVEIKKLAKQDFAKAQEFYRSMDYTQDLDEANLFYAAFYQDKIVGQVRLVRENGILLLRGMQVKGEFQFLGIGTRLIQMLEKDIGNEICYCIPYGWLEKFYSQIGFQIVDDFMAVPQWLSERFEKYLEQNQEFVLMRRR